MRTRIIAVLNQKGGVGKTTTCVNLGAALARRGHRVLLVDMDPQSNLTVHVGADFRQVRKSTYSLLLGEHALGPAVLPTPDPNLRYVPATLALANAEIQLASAVGRELLLREAIEVWLEDDSAGEPSPRAEYVFIDCPPSLGILTMNALCAANEVLLPIQAEFFALQGVAGILESLKAVQRLNRGLQLTMVVPCMMDKRRTLAREVMEEVDKYFGKLVTRTRIRNNVKLAEAPSHGLTIFEYDPSSNGAKDYESLAREVLGESLDEEPAPVEVAAAEAATVEAEAAAAEVPAAAVPAVEAEAAAVASDPELADAPAPVEVEVASVEVTSVEVTSVEVAPGDGASLSTDDAPMPSSEAASPDAIEDDSASEIREAPAPTTPATTAATPSPTPASTPAPPPLDDVLSEATTTDADMANMDSFGRTARPSAASAPDIAPLPLAAPPEHDSVEHDAPAEHDERASAAAPVACDLAPGDALSPSAWGQS